MRHPTTRFQICSQTRYRTARCIAAVVLFILLIAPLSAQAILEGRVVSCADSSSIAYANLYSTTLGIGTIADSLGRFSVPLPTATLAGHDLTVSSVGYETGSYTLTQFANDSRSVLCIAPGSVGLPEVVMVQERFGKARTYGNNSESKNIVTGWSVQPRSGAARGTVIKLPKRHNHLLREISLHLAQSSYDSLRLRINLHPVSDGNILPGATNSWLIDTDRSSGWVTLPVLEDEVVVRDRIFVSLEIVEAWSKREQNVLLLSAGFLTNGFYHRESSFRKWEKAKLGLSLTVTTLQE